MRNKQRGFNLVELLIALAVGLFLLLGVMSVFVGLKSTVNETSTYGELQENGRFALSVLSDDLLRQDFWGDYSGTFDLSTLNGVAEDAPTIDCEGDGLNNATFPVENGHFRTLWGSTVTSSSIMDCISDANVDSDVIQLKRVIADAVTATPVGNYYLTINTTTGEIFAGGEAEPEIANSQTWEYQHHIYYVRNEVQGSLSVPVLMQGRLTTDMTFDPIIDGIEMIRFMYGVDTTDDGIVNAFISADNMTQGLWNNANDSKIIAVKIYVLSRSILPDTSYDNTNSYMLGDLTFTADDNYRRLLFSTTVSLYNSRVDSW